MILGDLLYDKAEIMSTILQKKKNTLLQVFLYILKVCNTTVVPTSGINQNCRGYNTIQYTTQPSDKDTHTPNDFP